MSVHTNFMQSFTKDTYVGDSVDSVTTVWRKYAKKRITRATKELKVCANCNNVYDNMGRLENFPRYGLNKVGECKDCRREKQRLKRV